ncbi:MAG: YlxR family protein [Clostridia bacterium]|nr:YlxR family protein [Clostridia bacterium]
MKPQRMCVVCREMKTKEQLIRVVKSKDGVSIDTTFRAQGRGAYVCRSIDCIENAQKRRAFERSFSMKVDPELYSTLEALIKDAE